MNSPRRYRYGGALTCSDRLQMNLSISMSFTFYHSSSFNCLYITKRKKITAAQITKWHSLQYLIYYAYDFQRCFKIVCVFFDRNVHGCDWIYCLHLNTFPAIKWWHLTLFLCDATCISRFGVAPERGRRTSAVGSGMDHLGNTELWRSPRVFVVSAFIVCMVCIHMRRFISKIYVYQNVCTEV